MKHYGDRPPWDGEGSFGYWRLRKPDARSWFEDESSYWQWYPPQPSLTQVIQRYYVTPMKAALNEPVFPRLMKALERPEDISTMPVPEPRISMLTRIRMRLGLPVFK